MPSVQQKTLYLLRVFQHLILLGLVFFLAPLPTLAADEPGNALYLPLVIRSRAANDLPATSASYLGGTGSDVSTAVEITPDGSVLVAGTYPGFAPAGVPVVSLLNGGDGALLHMNDTGQVMLAVIRIGSQISDLQVNNQGQGVVCGSFGIAVVAAPYQSVQWSANPGSANRCSIGEDGTVAAKVGSRAYTYSATGSLINNWEVGGATDPSNSDILVDSSHQLVFVTGFKQDDGGTCQQLQIAFVRAYRYDGSLAWKRFDWSKTEAGGQNLCADTRGDRLAMGLDGKLYFAGESAGGNTIYQRDPANITRALPQDQLVKTDAYNNPYNTSSNHITWYGRFDPATGNLEKGQFLLPRLSSGKGNTVKPAAIMADATGQVYLSGVTTCCLPTRSLTIAGKPIGPYAGGEAFLLIVAPDFTRRILWTPFTLDGHSSSTAALALRGQQLALSANLTTGHMVTVQPFQPAPQTLPDTYLIRWPAFQQ